MLLTLRRFCVIFYIFNNLKTQVSSENILAVTTLASRSHHIFIDAYLLELVNRGHNVTLLGHEEDKHHHPNYTHIVLEGVYEMLHSSFQDSTRFFDQSPYQAIFSAMFDFTESICQHDLTTQGLKRILDYPPNFKFDLVIWDINCGHCMAPLIEKFGNPPVIGVDPFFQQPNFINNVYQSYIPFNALPYTTKMNSWQRLKNSLYTILCEMASEFYDIPRNQKFADDFFGKSKVTANELRRRISLVLVQYNPAFSHVQALPPNVIPVGGLHIKTKKLKSDFQKILDEAESGAILIAFGTNVLSKNFGSEKINAILGALSKLEQTVIWKFEDSLQNRSNNVHVYNYLPQNDILAHPNLRLFVTHCGLLSSLEAVYNGVPIVGIPFFLDQIQNVQNFVSKGIGEKLDFNDVTEQTFLNTLLLVLNNQTYYENAMRFSRLFKDQPRQPLESAIWWTEYVLRHGSPEHLNLAVRDMNFIQQYNIDIIGVALIIIMIIIAVILSAIVNFVKLFFLCCKKINASKAKIKIS